MARLKAAVVGVGRMGRHHARIYHQLRGVDLVAVVDRDQETANRVSAKYDCLSFSSLEAMLSEVEIDVASVVTPTIQHFGHATPLIDKRISVLIEKPLADVTYQARCLVSLADIPGITVAVGHVERCNPALRAVKRLVDNNAVGDVYRISTRRVGPSPERIRDVGVTLDLATHDLDIMRYLTGEEPIAYQVALQRRSHNGLDDSVNALIEFESGIIGVLECDWLTQAKHRNLTVVGSEGTIEADYLKQTAFLSRSPEIREPVYVDTEEPLRREIQQFILAARGEAEPFASANDGYRAVQMAKDILEVARG